MDESKGHSAGRPTFYACLTIPMILLAASGAAGLETSASNAVVAKDSAELDVLMDMDLASLMAVDVTSVAGEAQPWFTTPAAIYVISAEDIRRAGHLSIAEALRLVPGMQVSRITASTWAISSRGFQDAYANKLQVLMDGRVVFAPFFAGTQWNIQGMPLDDLDRIEIVRGPGATLWGANAVNGV